MKSYSWVIKVAVNVLLFILGLLLVLLSLVDALWTAHRRKLLLGLVERNSFKWPHSTV